MIKITMPAQWVLFGVVGVLLIFLGVRIIIPIEGIAFKMVGAFAIFGGGWAVLAAIIGMRII